jgi:hypothetical protein
VISAEVRARVRSAAGNRCGYCRSSQEYSTAVFEVEHLVPRAAGGSDEESNLWLACRMCNLFKGSQTHAVDPDTNHNVRLFNPRTQSWTEHFRWSENGCVIQGTTPCGRATVNALRLNWPLSVTVRGHWVSAGWHPPQD